MKVVKVFFLLILFATNAYAQKKTMPCRILDVIARDDDFGYYEKGKIDATYEEDTATGEITMKIYKQEASTQKDSMRYIVLIDTFNFFTPLCSGIYSNKNVVVRNRLLTMAEQKKEKREICTVGLVKTDEKYGLCVSIYSRRTNIIVAYFLSIFGDVIKIEKKRMYE